MPHGQLWAEEAQTLPWCRLLHSNSPPYLFILHCCLRKLRDIFIMKRKTIKINICCRQQQQKKKLGQSRLLLKGAFFFLLWWPLLKPERDGWLKRMCDSVSIKNNDNEKWILARWQREERRKQSTFKYLNVPLAVMINDNRNQVAIGAENEIGKREKLDKKRCKIEQCQFHPLQYACQLFNWKCHCLKSY